MAHPRTSGRGWLLKLALAALVAICLGGSSGLSAAAPVVGDAGVSERQATTTTTLTHNQTFINLAISVIDASQRASWEQGVAVQAILEWQYPEWTTWNAAGPGAFRAATAYNGKTSYPTDVILQAMRSVVAQDGNGRLGAKVTGDEDPNAGSSLDSAANLESVLVAALAAGQIGAGGALDGNLAYGRGASRAWNFITTKVRRGASGILSQRMDRLQYWADTLYMGPPAMAAYGLYTQNADALALGADQAGLYLSTLRYAAGSGSKAGLLGHIRNEDGSWPDGSAWLTGQGWGALGTLRVVAALGQSGQALTTTEAGSNTTRRTATGERVASLLEATSGLLNATHALFDGRVRLWHNYVDVPSTFADVSGSLAVAAATYRLATLRPGLVSATALGQAEAVYGRVVPQLRRNGQFGGGLQCVDALAFNVAGYTSVEALSFGLLLEAARRDYARVVLRGQPTALVRAVRV